MKSSTLPHSHELFPLVQDVHRGILSPEEALLKIQPIQIIRLISSSIEETHKARLIAKGHGVSSGCASGRACFSSDMVLKTAKKGFPAILLLSMTRADDTEAMRMAQGILTLHGGTASHAAIISRTWNKPCVVGVSSLISDQKQMIITEGEDITLNGLTGEVWLGKCQVLPAKPEPFLSTILQWADAVRKDKIGIRVNADTYEELALAIAQGAEGVGVCRTEHMFTRKEYLPLIQRAILTQEKDVFDNLKIIQRDDFKRLFSILEGRPITVRLLDAPLHEFLPQAEIEEKNPMLGLRGIRLAIHKPILYRTQMEAFFEAYQECVLERMQVDLEIMVPLVACEEELTQAREWFEEIWESSSLFPVHSVRFGTMIETPRAALIADKLAEEAEFFSFGTNDLTQMTYGFSRDDMHTHFLDASLMDLYLSKGILKEDPFTQIDVKGVGSLMRLAIEKGKTTRPHLKVGVCGEQASSLDSLLFYLD